MRILIFSLIIAFLAPSCKTQPGSDRRNDDGNPGKVYKLSLNPTSGTSYHYDITNESEVKLEVNDKTTDNLNKSTVGANYAVDKDSSGDFLFTITYDKIHTVSKKDDVETVMDADNAVTSLDPVDKMLNLLKTSRIVSVVGPSGVVKSVDGYKQIGDKVMAGFTNVDVNSRKLAHDRLEQVVGEGIVKKNMEQLFKIFPDSAIHVGDRWKFDSHQAGEFSLNLRNSFRLVSIDNGIALLDLNSDIQSDSTVSNLMGYDVVSDLKGKQEGEYRLEVATGMLLGGKITTRIAGSIQLMGREVPVTIRSDVEINGVKKDK